MPSESLPNNVAAASLPPLGPESRGKSVARDCLNQAIDGSGIPRKVLAAHCQMSEGYFSRLTSQEPLLDRLPSEIREDFARLLSAACDPQRRPLLLLARLATVAIETLAECGYSLKLPVKAGRPLKMEK